VGIAGPRSPANLHKSGMTRRAAPATLVDMTTDQLTAPGDQVISPRAAALRDLAAIAPGVAPFGVALGVVTATTRMGDVAGLLGAPLVYGGSAQLTATTMFDAGAGLLAIVGAALTVSARLLLYGAALAPRFRDQPAWFRYLGPHLIIDQTYLCSLARPQLTGRSFRTYWLGLGLGLGVVWTAAVAAGLLIGPRLPAMPHLSLAGTALFVGMLMPRLRDRASVRGAVVAAVVAPLVATLLPSGAVIVGAVAGLLASLAGRKGSS
jgi:predicted branched-subunit amino acid permease